MNDSYCVKLSGKAELAEPIEIGHNFHVELEGSVVSETIEDNDDGSKTHIYKFKPVLVEVITAKGERMRAKDVRSRSQQMRALLNKIWRETNEPIDFDTFYDKKMVEIMQSLY